MSTVVDFGSTAADYSVHRMGFPDEVYARLDDYDFGQPGSTLLDLGTGTGTLARGFARRGASVTAIDIGEDLIREARLLDAEANVSVDYTVCRAEEIEAIDNSFDNIIAGQCWHWFDGPRVAELCRKKLRPRGKLAICHFDWVPVPGNFVHAMERLIASYNPNWTLGGGTGMYPQWSVHVAMAGFGEIETFSRDIDLHYTHEGWRGRVRASAGVGASLPAEEVLAFDDDHDQLIKSYFQNGPAVIPHRLWGLVCRAP